MKTSKIMKNRKQASYRSFCQWVIKTVRYGAPSTSAVLSAKHMEPLEPYYSEVLKRFKAEATAYEKARECRKRYNISTAHPKRKVYRPRPKHFKTINQYGLGVNVFAQQLLQKVTEGK